MYYGLEITIFNAHMCTHTHIYIYIYNFLIINNYIVVSILFSELRMLFKHPHLHSPMENVLVGLVSSSQYGGKGKIFIF